MELLSGGSKGGRLLRAPPSDQNFLTLMQFLGKSGELASPHTGNPGSTPAFIVFANIQTVADPGVGPRGSYPALPCKNKS